MMTVAVTMMMMMMMDHRCSFSRRRKDVSRSPNHPISSIRALDEEKKTNVQKCGEFPPSATAERTNLHQGGPLLPLIHRLPIQVLKDERRAVSPTDTLSNLIGPLTENCRGRADKHHTAHHQSTGLQIEAHEQNSKMELTCTQKYVHRRPCIITDVCLGRHTSVHTVHRIACVIFTAGTHGLT